MAVFQKNSALSKRSKASLEAFVTMKRHVHYDAMSMPQ
jgi:hypothetical protein